MAASSEAARTHRDMLETKQTRAAHQVHVSTTESPRATNFDDGGRVIKGGRLAFLTVGLYLGAGLAQLEMTIVSTALVTITSDLHDFSNSTWIINSYLVIWAGFLVLWAQFSEVIGRKLSVLAATIIFVAFSAGCAGASTSTQLIIMRAFQGLGGAGVFNLAMVIISDAVKPADFPRYVAIMSSVAALAFAFGPLMGGAIATHSTWRWVFWLNIPAGALAFVLNVIAIPNGFSKEWQMDSRSTPAASRKISFLQLDWTGAILFLTSAILLITAFQEAVIVYAFKSATIITMLLLSMIALGLFAVWEYSLAHRGSTIVPIITWHFVTRRGLGLFIISFLVGVPFTSSLIFIPQRLQVVNGFSAYESGVRLIAYILLVPVGAVLGSVLMGKFKWQPAWAFLLGALFQSAAIICLAIFPDDLTYHEEAPKQYGFQILLGMGYGISNAVSLNSVPIIFKNRQELISPAVGAANQFRFLGSAVGLGVLSCVLNGHLRTGLGGILTGDQLTSVLQSAESIASLPTQVQVEVQAVFASGFVLQWRVLCASMGAQILAVFLVL